MKYYPVIYSLIILFLIQGCKSGEPFTGYSYDPEGVTNTADREINHQPKRTIGFLSDGVWITNEFPGARANDVVRVGRHHYKILIHPEISPINNSPWYGFRIWADDSLSVKVELEYSNGSQRYIPVVSANNGESWIKSDSTDFEIVEDSGNGLIHLKITSEPLWVSAQEVHTTAHFGTWLSEISNKPFIQRRVIGSSHQGRPIVMMNMAEASSEPVKGVILVYGRQHPPEVPGYLTGLYFLETLAGDSELSRQFRQYFDVWAIPLMNPDGADNGHWRTNAAGVDLNRDWQFFNQPETEAVRRALMPLTRRPDKKVFYAVDFHSTGKNVFYPIIRDIQTFPHGFTYRWLDAIQLELPGIKIDVEPFDIDSPISKNWSHKTFGIDAVTFEVWDEQPREELQNFAVTSAELFMKLMIREFEKEMRQDLTASD